MYLTNNQYNMKQEYVNNYAIDCIGLLSNEVTWSDLTEDQQIECKEYNS